MLSDRQKTRGSIPSRSGRWWVPGRGRRQHRALLPGSGGHRRDDGGLSALASVEFETHADSSRGCRV